MGFGSFELICERSYIPLCPLVGPYHKDSIAFTQGVPPVCFPRSVNLANTMVFNIGNIFVQFGTLIVVAISIFNSYRKYTAVGRREMLDLFYLFFALTFWSIVVDTGVTPISSGPYPYFVAIQAGLASAFCLLLMLTGLLGFQLWEDGSRKSVWGLRLTSTLWGVVVFVIALATFNNWSSAFSPTNTTGLMVVLYLFNALFLFLYAPSVLYITSVLVRDWWAFGAYNLALVFFVTGQVLMYGVGKIICVSVRHYIDGVFCATICNLFAFLMIYKAWDITTSEDLEFSVSNADGTWDVKSHNSVEQVDSSSECAMSTYSLAIL